MKGRSLHSRPVAAPALPGASDSPSRTAPLRISLPPLPDLIRVQLAGGEAVAYSHVGPAKQTGCEDSWLAQPVAAGGGVLAVADGLGGHRGGRMASQLIVATLEKSLQPADGLQLLTPNGQAAKRNRRRSRKADFRVPILESIEATNQELLRGASGAGTTLALVEIQRTQLHSYHVGDSEILVVGQRGRVKHQTISHSPVGYALQAGKLTEREALEHDDRHIVSNVLGIAEMRVEIGPPIELAPRDTVLIGSDGLFDNLWRQEIIDIIRKGPLDSAVMELAERATRRMLYPEPDQPSKADDLTIVAFRLNSSRRRKKSSPSGAGQLRIQSMMVDGIAETALAVPGSDNFEADRSVQIDSGLISGSDLEINPEQSLLSESAEGTQEQCPSEA